jgi:hypothetical protein
MENESNDTNAARVRNDEAFKAAPLSGANASWQRERWGDTMMDHGEARRAIERQVRERWKRGEGGDSMGGRSMTMTTSTLLPLPSLPPP